jgi:nucleotide-binding universal stress UspA family protein
MTSIQNVLVATDMTPDSAACWPTACALGRAFDARVHLLRAIADPEFTPGFDHVACRALREFDELSGQADGVSVAPDFRILSGDPPHVILETGREIGADVLVLGAHLGLGGVAEQVLGHADRPVWFVRPGQATADCETVLVAANAGEPAKQALAFAGGVARGLEAKLVILGVLEEGGPSQEELTGALKDSAASTGMGDAEVRIQEGTFAAEVLKALRDTNADLLVLGNAGRRGVERLRRPNPAEWAIRRAPVPLAVVPGGGA